MAPRALDAIGPYLARQRFARGLREAAALEERDFARERDDARQAEGARVGHDGVHDGRTHAFAALIGFTASERTSPRSPHRSRSAPQATTSPFTVATWNSRMH